MNKYNFNSSRLATTPFAETEFFVCCWSPVKTIPIEDDACNAFTIFRDKRLWMLSSKAPNRDGGLIRHFGHYSFLFRGYELDLLCNSYMEEHKNDLLTIPNNIKNGVFALISIDKEKNELLAKTDAFGVSPLYYRRDNDVYWFSSHPELISLTGDEPDYYSWLSLIQNGFIFGDRSFYSKIKRVPPGTEIIINNNTTYKQIWYDFSLLPKGEKRIDQESFQKAENSCQNSISKCLQLSQLKVLLPFSSGYDSRRFFASFQKRNVDFTAVTSQSYHRKNNRLHDIDSKYAILIAQKFGVDCKVIQAESDFAKLKHNYERRLALIGSETFMHEWSTPLIKWLRTQPPSVIFDGLAGDTLGNTGYEFEGLHKSFENDTEIIVKNMVVESTFRYLSKNWPSLDQYKAECHSSLGILPQNLNRSEIAFLLHRTRRAISPWLTMAHPPGHLIVFPYLELGFVNTCLEFNPSEKYRHFLQKECLKRFWPEYYHFHGSRKLPAGIQPISTLEENKIDSLFENVINYREIILKTEKKYFVNNLTRVVLFILSFIPFPIKSLSWFINPLFLLIKFKNESTKYICNFKK